MGRRAWLAAVCLAIVSCWTTSGKAQTVLESSAWNAERKTGGSPQKAAFRIEEGVIYHLDNDTPVGEAALDARGQLLLVFQGHRKLNGRAIVTKAYSGTWKGQIELNDGTVWPLVLRRR